MPDPFIEEAAGTPHYVDGWMPRSVIIPYTMLMNAGLGDVIIMIIEKNLPPSLMQAETAKHVRAALIACGRPQLSVVPGPPLF